MRKTAIVALAMTGFLAYGPEQSAKADIIQYNDLSDATSVVKIPPEGTSTETISIEAGPTCSSSETCSITIRGENFFGFTGATSTFPFTTVDANHSYMTILEPGGGVSDVVLLDTTNASAEDLGAVLTFMSNSGSLSGFLTPPGSPVENGTSQFLFSLNWSSDTAQIFVQSDVSEAVPEPGTLGLLAVGLAALGVIRRRKTVLVRAGNPGNVG